MQLRVRDVARVLSVNEKTVYRWLNQGILPAYRINNQYRFNRAELLEWATARKVNVLPEIMQQSDEGAAPLPSVSEALAAGGIFYRVGEADKESVLRSVVEIMKLPDDANRDSLVQILLARESLGSTAIGDGIAIPHVRNPIVLYVARPNITLCFLEQGVDFGALDGRPVNILFTLISPTVRAHLHLLSRLTFLLRGAPLREALLRQTSREEILQEVRQGEAALPAGAPRDGKED